MNREAKAFEIFARCIAHEWLEDGDSSWDFPKLAEICLCASGTFEAERDRIVCAEEHERDKHITKLREEIQPSHSVRNGKGAI